MKLERVLMTGDTVGGVWTFTLELAAGLAEHGIEVLLAAFGAKATPAQVAEAHAIPRLCLADSAYKLEWMEEPWADVEASGQWLMRIEDEYRPDVIHLNTFGHGALPWNRPVVLTAHSCVLSWWRAVRGENAPESWNRYRDLVAASLARVDTITTPSQAMSMAVQELYGVAAERCRTISNGRNAAKFAPRRKEPLVFTAGRLWDEAKNLRAVTSVAKKIRWPVYCAGDATGYTVGYADPDNGGCNMLGRLSESQIVEWYERAGLYAMPARYEPFGLSILEAALSGCALVLGDIPSLREIWGDAATFVRPNDSGALETAINHLIDDTAWREELAQRAYARALSFSATRMSGAYLAAYQDTVAAHSLLRRSQCIS